MRSLLSSLDTVIAPPPDPARVSWLREWTYAHRGLHTEGGAVENSPSAFRAALAAGLGIECDIQRSRDGMAMVYHDWDFARLLGRAEAGDALDAAEWRTLRYSGLDEGPFGLADLLAMVAGKVPLLIEIKSRIGYDVERSCEIVTRTLEGYAGRYAIMSFDPRVSRWLRRNSPQTVRGLVMRQDKHVDARIGIARHVALWVARPDFLAFDVRALPDRFAASLRASGFPLLTWTVKTPELLATARAQADALIAEGAGLP
jgi:glycerophosphoryl diester phosphodiesterase